MRIRSENKLFEQSTCSDPKLSFRLKQSRCAQIDDNALDAALKIAAEWISSDCHGPSDSCGARARQCRRSLGLFNDQNNLVVLQFFGAIIRGITGPQNLTFLSIFGVRNRLFSKNFETFIDVLLEGRWTKVEFWVKSSLCPLHRI